MEAKRPGSRAGDPPRKIDVRELGDLPGYRKARELQARVESLGIKYLHLTRPEHVEAIRAGGLKSARGSIYLADHALALAQIALTQVYAKEFHLFGLRHDESWEFLNDDCSDLISRHQWIYQGEIPPGRLVDIGAWRAVPPFDRFVPYPPGAFDSLMRIQGMDEGERSMHLARMQKGRWPERVLAYLEPRD